MSRHRQTGFIDQPGAPRALAGKRAYLAGLAAEEAVERAYLSQGARLAARRLRRGGGEIDLIFHDGDTVVFVEVKQARCHAYAAERVTPRQQERLLAGAALFLADQPRGALTDCRFDVALVDRAGHVDILENALTP